ncbi:ABC transporter ATP-binding protein [Anaeromicropila herbilytica]|uniref:Sugar ABC transporter ATP-binding protein n=1 Tax=Anaeromicropila herbilytica TaxID=2785025 RepID=A0A7R7ENX7_9FIRM|nr:ABC transporter ATP-binding protein [Anaeromicropila herbilytica]BCN32219.1 sugar ABC transporter ATP-binding protein [Anaeromicropila herbilytica]
MNAENVIEVKNVKKKFKVYFDKGSSLKEKILFQNRNRYEDRFVLRGINFNVKKGEAIGLLGKNGCGKSTTLKLLSRIMYPSEGTINIKGRVSSLLELGAGFHPDMSGRENIYTNASIFGLTRKEIDKRMDDIIKFSELEEFLDNPVRTYSSGMYMRLAFSVAINVNADVLLIDEILAVGDVSFQTKCFEKLKEIKAKGTTIIIVSHSMGQIEQICDRAIWIEDGLIKEEGVPKFVGQHYLVEMEGKRLEKIEEEFQEKLDEQNINDEKENIMSIKNVRNARIQSFCSSRAVRTGNGLVNFINVKLYNKEGKETIVFKSGEEITVKMNFRSNLEGIKSNFAVSFSRDDGLYCYGTSIYKELDYLVDIDKTEEVTMRILNNGLLQGKYLLNVGIYAEDDIEYDVIWNVSEIQIMSERVDEYGVCRLEHYWQVDELKLVNSIEVTSIGE